MIKGGFENWLDAIRIELYHKIKNMTNETAAAAINDYGKKLAENHGIDIVELEPIRQK
ncbi:MAG: hypothetical protein LBB40_01535 [Holophagales bacterium]|jgi:hypothetical protein|nr:hypothetical protein [Holophagales bacterium]